MLNRSIGSIEQVGTHFLIRSGNIVGEADKEFHGGKKVVNDFDELIDFLQDYFQISEENRIQRPLENNVHTLELRV
jgi:hypothetical protein